ncbi:hypothetical protein AOC36_08515 [Erysipelothrix larvae]|uniref:Uncharacterized protein n=1 Tax=Erysipelothrix larvae TaxID=1514105 RepID=A0A0X8H0X8_9FIRM|nr:hypothetical protein [Erysipelothrix larvae]AMC94027.1 hypothetical protein AOC36_08515 [Erysipelothrix larvae]
MEPSKVINQIRRMLVIIQNYEVALERMDSAKRSLVDAEHYIPKNLKMFDETNKDKYILEQVGDKPKALNKWNPFSYTQKRKTNMEEANKHYDYKRQLAEKEYYEKYASHRKRLMEEDNAEKMHKIRSAKLEMDASQELFVLTESAWRSETLFPEKIRTSEALKTILELFEEGRVETVKESINLYFDELRKDNEERLAAEHRKKIEEMIILQNENIQKAIDNSEKAISDSSQALFMAQQAHDKAEEAYNLSNSISSRIDL